MTLASYWDLEHLDDEAFSVVSLADRQALGQMLGVEPRLLLLGSEATAVGSTVTFAEIASRLAERVSRDGCSVEEFGQQIGWDISPVLADPAALWDFNVEGLYDICQTLGLNWVAALPSISASAGLVQWAQARLLNRVSGSHGADAAFIRRAVRRADQRALPARRE